jgi:hypothetical protein
LNFEDTAKVIDFSGVCAHGDVLLSTRLGRTGSENLARLRLRPNEGLVLRPRPIG